jgi:two-component system sensor histidine kinase KdpD
MLLLAAGHWSGLNLRLGFGEAAIGGHQSRTGSGSVGVIGIDRDGPDLLLTPEERRLLDALADQAAVAIERISLAQMVGEARVLAETERLRAALLTSISHDLRTPLATILGAVSSLRGFAENYDAEQREELLATLQDEAERLNRFVPKSARHDAARIGRHRPQARTVRHRRNPRCGVAAGGQRARAP